MEEKTIPASRLDFSRSIRSARADFRADSEAALGTSSAALVSSRALALPEYDSGLTDVPAEDHTKTKTKNE
jgi:hypothetical protein